MGKFIDLTGQKKGRWLVLHLSYKPKYWTCLCDCGTVSEVSSQSLRRGDSKSCGCYHKEITEQQSLEYQRIRKERKSKRCPKCNKTKDITCFAYNKRSWCQECTREYLKDNKHKYLQKKRDSSKIARAKLRKEVLTFYSSRDCPECACCCETTIEFLSIDHIQGGGAKHRQQIGRGKIYFWLKKTGFPEGFRVLCHNCNQALGAYGYCPHARRGTTEDSQS